MIDTWCVDIW